MMQVLQDRQYEEFALEIQTKQQQHYFTSF